MRFELVEEPGVELEVAFRIEVEFEVEEGELKVFPKAAERESERERVSVWGLLEFFLPPFTVLSTQLDC